MYKKDIIIGLRHIGLCEFLKKLCKNDMRRKDLITNKKRSLSSKSLCEGVVMNRDKYPKKPICEKVRVFLY